MTVQPEDIEPENARAAAPVADWRADPNFTPPQRLPWSELGPDFIEAWGFRLPRNKREHLEVVGPSGSGKTHLVETILQDHYREASRRRDERDGKNVETGAVFIATKTDDEKMINALQKAWKKMTPAARELALQLPYAPREKALIDRALATTS